MNDKVKPAHLSRSAYVYVRQSTASQVINNTESQRLQYNLQERAQQLGWPSSLINVIDQDLGRTASGVTFRLGFEQILQDICSSKVGGIRCQLSCRVSDNYLGGLVVAVL